MRVLLATQHYWPYDRGGSGISVRSVAAGLVAAGDDVTVLAQAPGQTPETHEHDGVRVFHLANPNRWAREDSSRRGVVQRALGQLAPEWHPRLPAQLREHLRAHRPQVLHTHVVAGVSTRIWKVARRLDIPVVHTLRDYYLMCVRGTMMQSKGVCAAPCSSCSMWTQQRRRHTRQVQAVVGLSDFVLQQHLRHGLFAGVPRRHVIPNAFTAHEDAKRSPGDDEVLRVGFLARLHPSKGVELLLDAARHMGPQVRTVIAGDGDQSYVQELRDRAGGLDVEFTGHIEPSALFERVDVLVVPSVWEEPFGRVLLEAFGYGVPVLCSRRGGAQELIEEGENGWLFEPTRDGELVEKLERIRGLLPGQREKYRQGCFTSVRRYGHDRMIEAHRELYARVLEGRSGHPPS